MSQRNFPEVLKTERLLLRRYRPNDCVGILKLVNSNRDLLLREFAQIAALRAIQDVASYVSEKRQQWKDRKTFCYGIWCNDQSGQIGQIQVKNISWEIPAAELGYFIGKAWQRCGYASESIRAILRLAFSTLSFERMFVRILPDNHESLSLAQKLGFRSEGLHRHAYRCGLGELHDVHYLALIQDDYRKLKTSRKNF